MSTMQLEGVLADRTAWTPVGHCPIGLALDVVGTRSALLLMREAAYGTTRFDDFVARVGITEAVAAARLRELVEAGLLSRQAYREPGQRARQEYVLTDMGRDLIPSLLALMEWGNRYLKGERGPRVEAAHTDCGAKAIVEIRCTEGHPVPLDELSLRAIPRPKTSA